MTVAPFMAAAPAAMGHGRQAPAGRRCAGARQWGRSRRCCWRCTQTARWRAPTGRACPWAARPC